MNQKYLFPLILVVILPLFLIFLLFISGVSSYLNRKFSDGLFAILPHHYHMSDEIVIIDIDEQSIAKYADELAFGQWPWKRNVYPTLLSFTHLIQPPKIILIDIMFTERSDYDQALIDANDQIGGISHAANFRIDPGSKILPTVAERFKRFEIPLPDTSPFPIYESAAFPNGGIGNTTPAIHVVNVIPDTDGVLRRFSPLMRWHELHYPTLPIQAFAEGKPLEIEWKDGELELEREDGKRTSIPLGNKGLVRTYFYSEEEVRSIPRYSAAGIIESMKQIQKGEVEDPEQLIVSPSVFANKIVILGTSAASTHDDVVIPYGLFPGVMAQSVFASNVIQGHCLRELEEYLGILFAGLLLLISLYVLFVSQAHWFRNLFPFFAFGIFLSAFYILYRNNLVLPSSYTLISFPLSYLLGFAYLTYTEGKEKRKFNSILRNLVDPGVVSQALDDMETLKRGGEWEITAFFSDVAGFSSISEELTASDLARLLNEYLSAMTEILKANSGTLDKYIGDAIVGIYGAPIFYPDHPKMACKSALEMVDRLEILRKQWIINNDYTPSARNMKFRIGLNCGLAKVGFMGTDSLASYTMMGDTVNLASRLEAAAKDYGMNVLVSETIESACKDEFHFRFLDKIRVKGKDAPVKIYGLICKKTEVTETLISGETIYRNAFQLYSSQQWDKAIRSFEEAMHFFGKDDASCIALIERCKILFREPPPLTWDGVFTRTTK
ncbi:adenylate/guanylate cyclase [Leptospira ryugenii]|uniref:Adenylate/guanylate cyclase n=1 Tax=Leptospira ryugenii TaxID=1917863 RepID=A0A2P2E4Q3_9LEPT|nr:adenylate/guanylate cyclase domain-containing protein [Leptospira ryugenii]GBF51861.1 adenylate/guanylate cyclase [Leptospira ryugenii]